jgi:hypothetical protein
MAVGTERILNHVRKRVGAQSAASKEKEGSSTQGREAQRRDVTNE